MGRLTTAATAPGIRGSAGIDCETDWVVYAKTPFEHPGHVLEYLARYTHRVALSNHRLQHIDDQIVTFRYKHYRGRRLRSLTLSLPEFVRRFPLHVLPKGFVRIRYYGFLANGTRARSLSRCRNALAGVEQTAAERPRSAAHDDELSLNLLPRGLHPCPHCKNGVLRCVQILERPPAAPVYPRVAA